MSTVANLSYAERQALLDRPAREVYGTTVHVCACGEVIRQIIMPEPRHGVNSQPWPRYRTCCGCFCEYWKALPYWERNMLVRG